MDEYTVEDKVNEAYTSTLIKLVDLSEKEYYTHLVDINRHQVIVARTLLWLVVVIIGAEVTFINWVYDQIGADEDSYNVLISTYVLNVLSIVAGVISFTLSLLAVPAFGGYDSLYKNSWADYSNKANELYEQHNHLLHAITMNDILTKLDQACFKGFKTNQARGKKLRIAAIFAIGSATIATIALIVFTFSTYL